MADTEITTEEETRNILRVLSFKFGRRHSDHYFKVGQRADVVFHRRLFAPLLLSLYKSTRVWVIHGDATFINENAHSFREWYPQDDERGDLIPAGTGVGSRLNAWEFVTEDGLLRHPDGATSYLALSVSLIFL